MDIDIQTLNGHVWRVYDNIRMSSAGTTEVRCAIQLGGLYRVRIRLETKYGLGPFSPVSVHLQTHAADFDIEAAVWQATSSIDLLHELFLQHPDSPDIIYRAFSAVWKHMVMIRSKGASRDTRFSPHCQDLYILSCDSTTEEDRCSASSSDESNSDDESSSRSSHVDSCTKEEEEDTAQMTPSNTEEDRIIQLLEDMLDTMSRLEHDVQVQRWGVRAASEIWRVYHEDLDIQSAERLIKCIKRAMHTFRRHDSMIQWGAQALCTILSLASLSITETQGVAQKIADNGGIENLVQLLSHVYKGNVVNVLWIGQVLALCFQFYPSARLSAAVMGFEKCILDIRHLWLPHTCQGNDGNDVEDIRDTQLTKLLQQLS